MAAAHFDTVAADAWKSFTDSISEVFEPAKPAEAPKPSQQAPVASSTLTLPPLACCFVYHAC